MATLNFATFKDGKRCSKESSLVVHLVVTYKSNSGKKRPTFFDVEFVIQLFAWQTVFDF